MTEDPCASVAAELQAALAAERAARTAAEQDTLKLRDELDEALRALDACRFPESTPYGAFLASEEGRELREDIRSGGPLYEMLLESLRLEVQRKEQRAAIDPSPHNSFVLQARLDRLQLCSQDPEAAADFVFKMAEEWLDDFPVMLQPGEGTWLVEREVSGDWGMFARSGEDALAYFLGPARLAAELPVETLFEDHLWDEDYGPLIQAALPLEKRAELQAKLQARMEEVAADPEEVEWIRERFPSFFE